MATWQVQEAKTRLSEVIERARTEGPQTITRHGTERAVVLSVEDYRALAAHKPDFKTYLLGGPAVDDFPVERDHDSGRPASHPGRAQHPRRRIHRRFARRSLADTMTPRTGFAALG